MNWGEANENLGNKPREGSWGGYCSSSERLWEKGGSAGAAAERGGCLALQNRRGRWGGERCDVVTGGFDLF